MRTTLRSIPLAAAATLALALTFPLSATDKSGRLSGNVVNTSTEKSEFTVRQGNATRVVEFTNTTAFTAGSPSNAKAAATASASDVSVGNYLTCVGTWDGVKLAATRCTVRPSKRP